MVLLKVSALFFKKNVTHYWWDFAFYFFDLLKNGGLQVKYDEIQKNLQKQKEKQKKKSMCKIHQNT